MATKALLRLFKAVQIENKQSITDMSKVQAYTTRGVVNGFVVDPFVQHTDEVFDAIESVIGLSGEQANASFHKSWDVVANSSMLELIVQQMVHYITTYGFERMGCYDEDLVYIPDEVLEVPGIEAGLQLTVVRGMTKTEILERILVLAGSGIALAPETLDDLMEVIRFNEYDATFVGDIKNKELKARLFDYFKIVPSEPVAYLRFVVNKLTDSSLLIKSGEVIGKLKLADSKLLDTLLESAPDNLASIFFRFKPIFLAMKSVSSNKNFFNRLRKNADKMHVPMKEDYLNAITKHIKNGKLVYKTMKANLDKVNVFRKIRLADALTYRLSPAKFIVYTVRNGRGWATEFDWDEKDSAVAEKALKYVKQSIATDIKDKVSKKLVYMPEKLNYALPATEKQFTGNLPTGSYVTVDSDMIIGISWENTEKRIDLDLALLQLTGKIGWDASYRSTNRDVLFSGDVTDAPRGASELFYFKNDPKESGLMTVNFFNFDEGDEVDCKILVASKKLSSLGMNYMVNPNNIIHTETIKLDKKQNILGFYCNVDGENRFYFSNVSVGRSISSSNDKNAIATREYMATKFANPLNFKELLELAGAKIIYEIPEEGEEYIDLTQLDKASMVELLVGE